MADITISDDCINCGNCVQACPSFVYEESHTKVQPAGANRCIICGHCVACCPVDAIEITELSDFTEFITLEQFKDLSSFPEIWLKSRRSIRNFTTDEIPVSKIEEILRWGESAPRAHNSNAFELIVIQNQKLLNQIEQALANGLADLMKSLRDREKKQQMLVDFGETKVNTWRKSIRTYSWT